MCSSGSGSPQEYAHNTSAQKCAGRQSEAATTRWGGKVKHRLGDSTVELFYLSALVPTNIAEQMPTTLFVTELAPVCFDLDSPPRTACLVPGAWPCICCCVDI